MYPGWQYLQVVKKPAVQSQQLGALLLGSVQVTASRHCCEQSRVHNLMTIVWVMEDSGIES